MATPRPSCPSCLSPNGNNSCWPRRPWHRTLRAALPPVWDRANLHGGCTPRRGSGFFPRARCQCNSRALAGCCIPQSHRRPGGHLLPGHARRGAVPYPVHALPCGPAQQLCPGGDRAPPGHSCFRRGQLLSFPVCFQGVHLCRCSEQLGGQSCTAVQGGATAEGWRTLLAPTQPAPFLPFFLHKALVVFLLPFLFPLLSRSFCPPPAQLGSPVSLSSRQEGAMPYLYQNSKPRPPMLPGAARATHCSGKTYEELKQECLHRRVLFEDADFPACNSSLFFSEKPPVPFIWKRPGVSTQLCSLLAP